MSLQHKEKNEEIDRLPYKKRNMYNRLGDCDIQPKTDYG
jgi:hypothetical protein